MISFAHVNAQQSFCSISLEKVRNHSMVNFSVPKEVNVSYYRIEAGRDSTAFEVIGTVRPAGNSVFAHNYHYEVYGPLYKYYRIAVVGMGFQIQYSNVITTRMQEPAGDGPFMDAEKAVTGSTVVR